LHENNRVLPPDEAANAEPKWSCAGGMRNLPRALAAGLDIRTNTLVRRIVEDQDGFTLFDNDNRVLDCAARVVLSIPAPQAADLLENSTLNDATAARIALLRSVEYSRCLSVLLRFAVESDDFSFYALLARDRAHPLLWLARENAKPGFVTDTNQTALIAQLGHEVSCRLWEANDA
jgi:predicted NAD/FAD-dependent oxidoreductase